ncbi:hypothetical protein HanIR_Chr01g0024491 [Helianthus annuus]|nr:hypothetical protein HanIR_Chr01g0024491 [Helianthus annuus]
MNSEKQIWRIDLFSIKYTRVADGEQGFIQIFHVFFLPFFLSLAFSFKPFLNE